MCVHGYQPTAKDVNIAAIYHYVIHACLRWCLECSQRKYREKRPFFNMKPIIVDILGV